MGIQITIYGKQYRRCKEVEEVACTGCDFYSKNNRCGIDTFSKYYEKCFDGGFIWKRMKPMDKETILK